MKSFQQEFDVFITVSSYTCFASKLNSELKIGATALNHIFLFNKGPFIIYAGGGAGKSVGGVIKNFSPKRGVRLNLLA